MPKVMSKKQFETIKITANGKEQTLPKYVTIKPGKFMWIDDLSGINISIGDFERQYAELDPDMDLRRVQVALQRGLLVPFNPKKDILPYNKANAISPKADLSVLRNDDAWVIIQGNERQVLADIRKIKDRVILERAFKYETNNMNTIKKSRANVVDELQRLLKKVKPKEIVQREEDEEISVRG